MLQADEKRTILLDLIREKADLKVKKAKVKARTSGKVKSRKVDKVSRKLRRWNQRKHTKKGKRLSVVKRKTDDNTNSTDLKGQDRSLTNFNGNTTREHRLGR